MKASFQILRQFPATWLLAAAMIVGAVISQSHYQELAETWLAALGFSPQHLIKGDAHRLFTSLFLTAGGARFYASLLMLVLIVGAAERRHPSLTVALVFLGVHLTTLLALSLLALAMDWRGSYYGELLAEARDVGPSAGYYGCLGLALHGLPQRYRSLVAGAACLMLVIRLLYAIAFLPEEGRQLNADVAHLIALALGLFVAAAWLRSRSPATEA
ncbi:rhomboid family intramembrane serine protease [Lignipirellula cremea]|uniref:Rhomboid family protein n=1 Tax=Lignipirellula cremea TaxID=2528010 RepID=A0A518DL16_9BACT|nr:rhomboid family intramembrane serine protease [Lignipirellula cremea]QDU92532.1 Rhomboid family protein [Lignipirellula cremea]